MPFLCLLSSWFVNFLVLLPMLGFLIWFGISAYREERRKNDAAIEFYRLFSKEIKEVVGNEEAYRK